jgi:2-C-methyl-D-erythritol 4-phosphate cytidylyltransferase
MNYGLIIAAGKGGKFGATVDRAFLSLGPNPVLAYSVLAFEQCEEIDGVVIVVRKDRVDAARSLAQLFGCSKLTAVVAGGTTRQASVQKGLDAIPDDAKFVAVHESSRPCVTPELILESLAAAKRGGASSVALKVEDAAVLSDRGTSVNKVMESAKMWTLQSPQSFKIDLLRRAVEKVDVKNGILDEASAVEALGESVRLVQGSPYNIKILTVDDLPMAATLLKL